MPHDYLISPAARERWIRWNKDLKQAERQEWSQSARMSDDRSDTLENGEQERQSYTSSRPILPHQYSGLRNESQTYSPRLTPGGTPEANYIDDQVHEQNGTYVPSPLNSPAYQLYTDSARSSETTKPFSWTSTSQGNDGPSLRHHPRSSQSSKHVSLDEYNSRFETSPHSSDSTSGGHDSIKAVGGSEGVSLDDNSTQADTDTDSQLSLASIASTLPVDSQLDGRPLDDEEDHITDTVGAIAVDCYGNIAAGSSSGGIGMKHKGRTGPAALVGIGTSVFPTEADDKTKTCVAAVTSGTGEHMATTSAASLCAARLYHNQKKGRNGTIMPTDEEGAIRAFIEKDFMGKFFLVANYPYIST
jgi:taspase (threonine aspartase 1)